MSPVIGFDIAVVAKKVKVQCCYIMAYMLNLKKWGCLVSSRSGWLLELLTELIKQSIKNIKNRSVSISISIYVDISHERGSFSLILSARGAFCNIG